MATFAQETNNDLRLVKGQLVLVTDPAEETVVELRNKFQFVKGEFFLDTRQGVPYFAFIFVKNPDLLLIRQLFRNIILSAKRVKRVVELVTDFDSAARKLSFSFRAETVDGSVITGGSNTPFIVEP